MDWGLKMNIGEGVALGGFILTVLGLLLGAAWWMSSLHTLVKAIAASLKDFGRRNEREHGALWNAVDDLRGVPRRDRVQQDSEEAME
jgi:hypothetical protein